MQLIVFGSLALLAVIVTLNSVIIVPQSKAYVVERLGAFHTVWETGLHLKIPFLERVAKRVSLKEQVVDFAPQPVITKDNVTMQIDSVIFMTITDLKLATYGVEKPMVAIENLTATTLRNIIGEMELDQTLTSRDIINSRMCVTLDEATDRWGIKINRVELKNIMPPRDIQESMEKQMRAERERREQILQAQGQKEADITIAEGKKEARILDATAAKEASILEAQASKEAAILAAEAAGQAALIRAEGEAKAIERVKEAEANGLRKIKSVEMDQALLCYRSMEAMEKVADGQATKIIIPSEMQKLIGNASGLVEALK